MQVRRFRWQKKLATDTTSFAINYGNKPTTNKGEKMTTQTKQEHTETPISSSHPSYYSDDAHAIYAKDGHEIIASYVKPENAAFIVVAVNAHEALVESLKDLLTHVQPLALKERAEKALKLAE